MAIFLGFLWVGESSLDDRIITTRYLLLILAAMTAFSAPYLLFPDRNSTLLQLGNVTSENLMIYVMKRIMKLIWPIYLLIAVMMLGDIHAAGQFLNSKFIYLLTVYLIFTGLILISIARYIKSGLDSQFWKESDRGREIRKKMADYAKYPIDPGSIPSLLNTIWITTLGFAMIIISAIIGQSWSGYGVLFLSAIFFIVSVIYIYANTDSMLKDFYASNAFFLEFFGSNLKGEDLTSKHEVAHLWWVPSRFKVHVWQFLVQIDRKIPAGRVVFTGHLLIWFFAYQRPEQEFIAAVWILFAIIHHLFLVLTFQVEMSPGWLHRWLASGWVWLGSRFWMQLRWVIPLLLSMNAQYFVFGTPDFEIQLQVVSLFIIFAMFLSAYGMSGLNKEVSS
tara:strand:- start:14918 stop:16090 length:1173 start_codon:yes stop_codon:yes gene_type:complete